MPEPASAHEPYFGLAQPPEDGDWAEVAAASQACRACHLWMCGTQTVFGEGPSRATVMMVGEQPGDKEDVAGKPFVGPAGKVLDKALSAAGIPRQEVYLTNAVKHFKWEAGSGGRRLHAKPNRKEVAACLPWLERELALVRPVAVVLLGATAAQALLGQQFRLTHHRGQFLPSPLADLVLATVHPSAILRAPDEEARRAGYEQFVDDLRRVAEALASPRLQAKLL